MLLLGGGGGLEELGGAELELGGAGVELVGGVELGVVEVVGGGEVEVEVEGGWLGVLLVVPPVPMGGTCWPGGRELGVAIMTRIVLVLGWRLARWLESRLEWPLSAFVEGRRNTIMVASRLPGDDQAAEENSVDTQQGVPKMKQPGRPSRFLRWRCPR